jgi:hypothetical protein
LDDHDILVEQGKTADVVLRKSYSILPNNIELMISKKPHLQTISKLADLSSKA